MIKIAIYGKGGIGKSTTTANLSASFARLGLKVMQIGCDPKSDSTSLLMHGQQYPTVLDTIRNGDENIALDDLVHEGCGGELEELDAYERYRPDVVLYDVLGDVVCGGFAMPMRRQYADCVYIVTSGEKMSLFAARNIASAIENFRARGYARLGGVILNRRNVEDERARVEALAMELKTEIAADVPRSGDITRAENMDRTAVEAFPDSEIAGIYMALAKKLLEDCKHGE